MMSFTRIDEYGLDNRFIIKNDGYSMFMSDLICYF